MLFCYFNHTKFCENFLSASSGYASQHKCKKKKNKENNLILKQI